MKIKWNKKYTTISIYAFLVLALGIIFYRVTEGFSLKVFHISGIFSMLMPVFIALAMAYILNILLEVFERNIFEREKFKKVSKKTKRNLSLALAYLTFFLLIALFTFLLVPHLVSSIQSLAKTAPKYIRDSTNWVENQVQNGKLDPNIEKYLEEQWNTIIQWAENFLGAFLPKLGNFIIGLFTNIINFFFALILSFYFLIQKEHMAGISNKLLFATLPTKTAYGLYNLANKMDKLMRKFLKGQLILAIILGSTTFIFLSLLEIKYSLLFASIIFVADFIPIVGSLLGGALIVLLVFLQMPTKAIWTGIFLLLANQIEANILQPRIQGKQMGISAFWILVTLIVANYFFGIIGMFLGLPVFVLIYTLIRDLVNNRLKEKNLPENTDEYINLSEKSEFLKLDENKDIFQKVSEDIE